MRAHHAIAVFVLAGCAQPGTREDPDDWYDPGASYDVTEPLAFTDAPYPFPADPADGIGQMFRRTSGDRNILPGPRYTTVLAEGDGYGQGSVCPWEGTAELPIEVEGIVTLHPRYYYKTNGCEFYQPELGDSEEKYYGSYFIEDGTQGVFVLGDSKVAHFDMGDRVRMRIRGVKTAFGLDMVTVHDILEVERHAAPISYKTVTTAFSFSDCCEGAGCDDQDNDGPRPETCPIGKVHRVSGTVVREKDTFGEFGLLYCDGEWAEEDADGEWACPKADPVEYSIALDVELNRRGVDYAEGQRIQVTGPVLYSFSIMSVIVMRVGQVTEL